MDSASASSDFSRCFGLTSQSCPPLFVFVGFRQLLRRYVDFVFALEGAPEITDRATESVADLWQTSRADDHGDYERDDYRFLATAPHDDRHASSHRVGAKQLF